MAKVIDLADRKKIKTDLGRAEKLESLQSLLRCNTCGHRCAKCGSHGEAVTGVTHQASGASFRLCSLCADEYQDLLAYLNADSKRNIPFWCNREWVRQWLAWLDYQSALSNFASSPEVLVVISELSEDS